MHKKTSSDKYDNHGEGIGDKGKLYIVAKVGEAETRAGERGVGE